jgi:hypothetical protein
MSFTLNYDERVQGAGSSKFGLDRGVTQRIYTPVQISSTEDFFKLNRELLGYTKYSASGDGRLVRTMPAADPVYPFLFAESIDSIKGQGTYTKEPAQSVVKVPPLPYYARYGNYDVQVSFTMKPYSVMPDDSITVTDAVWFPAGTANGDSTNAEQQYRYPNEWRRFTTQIPLKPTGDYLTQTGGTLAGTMAFDDSAGAAAKKTCAFMPSVKVPNFNVTIVWRAVPLRYITSKNSYIANKGWQNRVNQNAVQLPFNGPNDQCEPGTLLYVDFDYTEYTPPTGFNYNLYNNGTQAEKLVDIALHFIWTTRKKCATDATPAITNNNYVAAGHNLLAWHGDFNWHYAILPGSPDKRPVYLSAPLELLQCDPDASQPGTIG